MSEISERLNAALSDRYRIEKKLGEGGMAVVYLAKDVRHERDVALKVLKPELAAVIGAERFLAEIKTTAALQHPHILPLFDSGEADGFLYYVMPYIRGETLRDKLDREKQLGVDEAWQIAKSVADALDYAHRAGVIHRDIKPANILLHDGRPVVADFGIALAVSAAGGDRITETGLSLGTPHYMSPEQASADQVLSIRTDVYSLGCVLYEMLAGQPPHTAISAQKVLVKILTETPRPLVELRQTVPAHLSAVVMKSIEKLPADRFESAKAFMDALADASFTYAQATPVQPVEILEAARTRRRLVPALAATTVVALLLALAGWLREPGGGAGGALRLTLDVGDIVPVGADISPDGSTFVVADERRGLFLRHAADEDFRPIPGTEGGVLPAFSRDGAWISFSRDGVIQRVNQDGSSFFTIFPEPRAGSLLLSTWSDDGTVVAGGPGGVWRLRPGEDEPQDITGAIPRDFRWLELLPDGSGLLVSGLVPGVQLVEFASDSIVDLGLAGYSPRYSRSGHILFSGPGGVLYAVPFEADSKRVTGARMAVREGLLMGESGASLSVSSGGTLLYVTGEAPTGPEAELLVFDASSGRELEKLPLPADSYDDGRYSPDGDRLALEIRRGGLPELFVYDVEPGTLSQLTFEGDNHQPRWSPDGERLAFASDRPGTRGEDIWTKAPDGASAEVPFYGADGDVHVDAWPTDSLMVIAVGRGRDVLHMGADTVLEPLVRGTGDLGDVDVSPDGRFAAYLSYEVSGGDIFVTRFPSGSGKWRITTDGATGSPRWSPDGRTIYYEGGGGSLYAADIRTQPSPALVRTRVVLENVGGMSFWDVHPDGRRILVGDILPADAVGRQRFWVVANWYEELDAMMKERGR